MLNISIKTKLCYNKNIIIYYILYINFQIIGGISDEENNNSNSDAITNNSLL